MGNSPIVASTISDLRAELQKQRLQGLTVGIVPTMGALHDGHLSLIKAAKSKCDYLVSTIFVNPTQFGEGEDFSSYPRTIEADIKQLKTSGVHLVFAPAADVLYPNGVTDSVRVTASPSLSGILEGAKRPGHFDGVTTVVSRLFNLISPNVAVFGEKDYQQLLVIRRMAQDLGYRTRVHAVETVREPGGLAMSSRNSYLGPDQLHVAKHISETLDRLAKALINGENDFNRLEQEGARWLKKRGLKVDYVAIRRASDLQLPGKSDRELRVLVAAFAGKTRLIDNKSANNICN